jgi:hypothetical protein
MSPKFLRSLLLTAGSAVALSSCSVFKKDDPAPANDPYAAANPYATGATGAAPPATPGYPAANAYGAPANPYAGTNPYDNGAASGAGYPPASQPYVQPTTPPTGPGYAGAYDNGGAAPAATGGGSGRVHKVAPRENLTVIGRRYGVTVNALMRANNLKTDRIIEGQKLNIP